MKTEDSYHYQAWVYDQLEPEEKLFVGRKPKRETPTWMLKGAARQEPTESENEEKNDEYLRKHGVTFTARHDIKLAATIVEPAQIKLTKL